MLLYSKTLPQLRFGLGIKCTSLSVKAGSLRPELARAYLSLSLLLPPPPTGLGEPLPVSERDTLSLLSQLFLTTPSAWTLRSHSPFGMAERAGST